MFLLTIHPINVIMLPEPPFTHGTPSRTGVLLVNLGTPESPTAPAVRAYLREFLSDPRVVEIPRPVWWLILNLFILTTRPKQSAGRYAQVWTGEGSPLKVHTERQTTMLRGYLGERVKLPLVVDYAMRYGKPSIADKLQQLKAQNCDRILLLPLYPQYSASTTATAFDEAFAAPGADAQPAGAAHGQALSRPHGLYRRAGAEHPRLLDEKRPPRRNW